MEERDGADRHASAGGRRISRRDALRYGSLGLGFLAAGPLLAACGGGDDDGDAASGDAGNTSSSAAGATGGGGGEEFRVGFAYVGPVSDNGWTFQHNEGRKAVEAAYPNVRTTFVESVPFSAEATQVFERLASENQMVIVNSEYADLLGEVAERHPDVHFLECNGHSYTENLGAYYLNHHKAAYILGVAAGMLTKNGRLGYVGAFPAATVYNDTNAFLLGARTMRPDAQLQVVMINSFIDPPKATQAANALLDGGADVLFDVQDDTSVLQVAQRRGAWSCIWNKDNRQFGPDAYVNAIAVDFAEFYRQQVGQALQGTWKAPTEAVLLELGQGFDLPGWGQRVPQDVQAKGNETRQRVLDGSLDPYAGPLKDASGKERVPAGKTLTAQEAYLVDWSVEGVTGVT